MRNRSGETATPPPIAITTRTSRSNHNIVGPPFQQTRREHPTGHDPHVRQQRRDESPPSGLPDQTITTDHRGQPHTLPTRFAEGRPSRGADQYRPLKHLPRHSLRRTVSTNHSTEHLPARLNLAPF
jgi:hypothetical protein